MTISRQNLEFYSTPDAVGDLFCSPTCRALGEDCACVESDMPCVDVGNPCEDTGECCFGVCDDDGGTDFYCVF